MFAETPFSAISRSNWSPGVSLRDHTVQNRLVSDSWFRRGPGLQLMQFNNPPLKRLKMMTLLRSTKPKHRWLLRHGCLLLLLAFVFAWLAPAPAARSVVPPPDGGYPNFNTAEGVNALFSLTTGSAHTAVGFFSLFFHTTRSFNTAP